MALLERVRQRIQRTLATRVTAYPIAAASAGGEAQVWRIGPTVRFTTIAPARAPSGDAPAPLPGGRAEVEGPVVTVYDYVPAELGERLRAQGICYADAAGNAWVRHPELLIAVQGCARPRPAPAQPRPRLPVEHLQLLFHVLAAPAIAAYPVPALAAHTGLPPAVVVAVQQSLAAQGLWLPDPAARLSDLAGHWLRHYPRQLRNRLNAQRYRWADPAAPGNWFDRALPADCLWSGEAAAHRLLAKAEAPAAFTLYSRIPRAKLLQRLGLVPHRQGNVEVLNTFFLATEFAASKPGCVPPLLVYADLLASPAPRCEALARELRAQYLADC